MAEQAVLQAVLKLRDDFSKELNKVVSNTGHAGKQISESVKGAETSVTSLRAAFAALGGFIALRFLGSSLRAFAQAERAAISFRLVLDNMGKSSATKEIQRIAKETERLGIADEEAVLSAAKFLAINEKMAADMLPRATRAAVGLAAVLGVDVVTAARQMTQAFASGSQGLRWTGIRFDEAAVKAGDMNAMLASVEKVGGEAVARFAEGSAAKVDRLGFAWDNLKKKMGEGLAEALKVAESVAKVLAAEPPPAPAGPAVPPRSVIAQQFFQWVADQAVKQKELADSLQAIANNAQSLGQAMSLTAGITKEAWDAALVKVNEYDARQKGIADLSKQLAKEEREAGLGQAILESFQAAGIGTDQVVNRLAQFREAERGLEAVADAAAMTGKRREAAEQSWKDYWANVGDLTVQSMEFMKQVVNSFASGIANVVGELFDQLWEGQIKTAKDFKNALEDMLRDLIKAVIKEMIRLVVQYAVLAAASVLVGAEKGGVFQGGWTPIRKFQGGGVVDRPTLGLVGEGGQNEAVVPLPDNKNIPVKIVGGGGLRGGDTYEVYISAVDGPSLASMLESDAGREAIDAAVFQGIRQRRTSGRAARGGA